MEEIIKEPISEKVIRFQDCDPYGHLNNSKYLDYMLNAREDHLIEHYDLNVFHKAQKEGISWVVGHNEIVYLKPVLVMEKVAIQTRLIDYSERFVQAEMVMYDTHKTHIKSVLWTKFFHFNFKKGKAEDHTDEQFSLFQKIQVPVGTTKIDERSKTLSQELKKEMVIS